MSLRIDKQAYQLRRWAFEAVKELTYEPVNWGVHKLILGY